MKICILKIPLLICLVLSLIGKAKTRDFTVTLQTKELFSPTADLTGGILGTVNPGGSIEVLLLDAFSGTIIYQISLDKSSTSEYGGKGIEYSKKDLGKGATYYPEKWMSTDIYVSAFAFDRYRYDTVDKFPYSFLSGSIIGVLKITIKDAELLAAKVPGLGIFDENWNNPFYNPSHFCHSSNNNFALPCKVWTKLKSPNLKSGSDLIIAAHRGIWGQDLGNGNPENSTISIHDTKPVTDVLESDVMIMKDSTLVISHDYNLHRLSNYQGPSTDYLFNMNYDQIKDLMLRKRNESGSFYKYLRFEDLVDEIVKNKLVVTIDIKDIRARYKDGKCISNCEYDDKTDDPNQNTIARKKILDSWRKIFRGCVRIAKEKNALAYIAFKVSLDFDDIQTAIPKEDFSKILFMPVVQPGNDLNKALTFLDSWIAKSENRVIAFETNFRTLDNVYVRPFDHNGNHYENILHYVYDQTGLRSGAYPEEPMGPRGIVSRWADWLIKDLREDMRGDHLLMFNIPFGNIMVLTTDRPEIWKQIEENYKKIKSK